MEKREIAEIKKQLAIDKAVITKISHCYVNGEKEVLSEYITSGQSISEDEEYKYLELFKAMLTGAVDKKLLNLSFPTVEESEGGAQNLLYKVNENKREDDVKRMHRNIIDNLAYGVNYTIITGFFSYDVPAKASDGAVLEDGETTFEFMLCAVCPVKMSKAGLTFNVSEGKFEEITQIPVVEKPVLGFMFPAFNDRACDIHNMLYFSKKEDEIHEELISTLTGDKPPVSSKEQQTIFEKIVEEVTNDNADFELVKNIHDRITEKLDNSKFEGPQSLILGKEEIRDILVEAGVSDDNMTKFNRVYEESGADEIDGFNAGNLMDVGKFDIESPDIKVKVSPDKTDLVEQKVIDGRKCLVISLEGNNIEVNGLYVNV